ncbi:MAG: ABC transporter permease [bacterium]|nr:ABC transporter permease [bacterium]
MANIKTATVRMDENKPRNEILNSFSVRLKQLVTHRNLFLELSIHDFHAQYLGSVLGFFWSIIKPLALIGVYAVIFSSVMAPVTSQQGEPINFGMFLFAGMLPWLAIQESLQRGATVFIDFAHLVRHHAIPLNLLPLTIVLSATASQIIAVIAFILIKLVVAQSISYHLLLVLALIPVQLLFCYGLALSIAVLNVFLRDFSHLTTTVLFIWFFTSPIVYPLASLPATLQKCMWVNPLTSLIDIYRQPLLFESFPSMAAIFIFIGFSVLFLFTGLFLFNKTNKSIVDWI